MIRFVKEENGERVTEMNIKKLAAFAAIVLLSGCAGMSPTYKEQSELLEQYHEARVKHSLATIKHGSDLIQMLKSRDKMEQRKQEMQEAKDKLKEAID